METSPKKTAVEAKPAKEQKKNPIKNEGLCAADELRFVIFSSACDYAPLCESIMSLCA